MIRNILTMMTIVLMLSACGKDQLKEDRAIIEAYLVDNNLTAEVTPEGLYYIIEEPGNDEHPVSSSFIKMHYEGYFTNGNVFDTTSDDNIPLDIGLFQVIEGWKIGIPLFGKGGKGKLLIPSTLAYGEDGRIGIPENAVLIFDIELIDFQ